MSTILPRTLRIRILFRGKTLRTRTFDRDRIVIGRDPECDLRLFNVGVSRHHALIERHEGNYELRDVGSSNGTWVDDRRIKVWPIQDGDRIRITKFELVFELVDAPVENAAPATADLSGFTEERTMSLADE